MNVIVRLVARLVTHSLFRSLHRTGVDDTAFRGPSIIVATHFGGFADPVMLLASIPQVPRFLAKSTLWDAFWLAPILTFVRAIPVFRAQDGATGDNRKTFEAATEALVAGDCVGIFPEGFANDDPGMHPLKTGAARLALDAHGAGVRGLKIVPYCGQYERKTRLRTRAWFAQGQALDLDTAVAEILSAEGASGVEDIEHVSSDDREAVRALNERIAEHMRAIAPVFADPDEAATLIAAGREAEGDDGSGPAFGRTRASACALARRPRAGVEAALAQLRSVGVGEEEPVGGPGSTGEEGGPPVDGPAMPSFVLRGVAALVLTPFAAIGFVMNALPWLLIVLGRTMRDAPVKEVTINVFVAPIAFSITWIGWAITFWVFESIWWGAAAKVIAIASATAWALWWDQIAALRARQRQRPEVTTIVRDALVG